MKIKTLIGGIFLFVGLMYSPAVFSANNPQIIINEIMYNFPGSDVGHEWIELKNSGTETMEIISSWRFNDGSNHLLTFYQGSNFIEPNGFIILASDPATFLSDHPDFTGTIFKSAMSLNNTSANLKLSLDSGHTWLGETQYSSTMGADGDGKTLELGSGIWQVSQNTGGTPGKENSIIPSPVPSPSPIPSPTVEPVPSPSPEPSPVPSPTPIPSAPAPIPTPDPTPIKKEFSPAVTKYINIEKIVYLEVDIKTVYDGDTMNVKIGDKTQKIRLIGVDSPEGSISSQFKINEPFYNEAKEFAKVKLLNQKIYILYSQDQSKKYDSFDRLLVLVVTDDNLFNTQLLANGLAKTYFLDNDLIKASQWQNLEEFAKENRFGIWKAYNNPNIQINEILPNPKGNDKGNEWIELKNCENIDINLGGWLLDDEEGGSHPYQFPASSIISSNGYLVIGSDISKITLNNSNESVRLFRPDLYLISEINYTKIAKEGMSFAKFDGFWLWTKTPTPGYENIFNMESGKKDPVKNNSPPISVTEAKNMDTEEYVLVEGAVSVEPNILSNLYFYIQDENSGIQIYSSKKLFSDLHLGDKILVYGKIGAYSGAKRIRIYDTADIEIIGHNSITPVILDIVDVNKNYEGKLVKIHGMVTKKSGSTYYLADDTGEIIFQIRGTTGINLTIKKGDYLEITGILYQSTNKLILLPRYGDDINIISSIVKTKKNTINKTIISLIGKAKAQDVKGSSSINIDYNQLPIAVSGINLFSHLNFIRTLEYIIILTSVLLIFWMILCIRPENISQKT